MGKLRLTVPWSSDHFQKMGKVDTNTFLLCFKYSKTTKHIHIMSGFFFEYADKDAATWSKPT